MRTPPAQPVMSGVWPRAAEAPLDILTAGAAVHVPDMSAFAPLTETPVQSPAPALAASTASSAPSPAGIFLVATADAVPTMAAQAPCRFPEPASPALVACTPVLGLAGPAEGEPPAGVKSLLVPSAATLPEASPLSPQM